MFVIIRELRAVFCVQNNEISRVIRVSAAHVGYMSGSDITEVQSFLESFTLDYWGGMVMPFRARLSPHIAVLITFK